MEKLFLSGREAREYIGISASELTKALNSGELPAAKRGNRWRILKEDLDAFARKMVDSDTERRRE